jgi:hypothetical protein
MNLKDLIRQKLDRLESVPDALVSATEKAQKALLQRALELLDKLETKDGNLALTSKNLAQREVILTELLKVLMEGDYIDAVTEFAKEIGVQVEITNNYLEAEFKSTFTEETIYKDILRASQKQALSYFDEDAVAKVLIQPLREQLTASMTSGASMPQMIKSLTAYIQGNYEIDGALLRHVKQVSYDAFAVTDRQYTEVVARALDVEFYLYQGGLISDSREFCTQHNGKYYHRKEIEAMAAKEWQGKRKGTNTNTIMVYAGGYQCRHSWLPVSEFSVPKDVMERAREKGYID